MMAMLLLQVGAMLFYDFADSRNRLPFHYAADSPGVTRVLLHYYCHRKILSDRYFYLIL